MLKHIVVISTKQFNVTIEIYIIGEDTRVYQLLYNTHGLQVAPLFY
jgi:hypothetical protein